MTPAADLVDAKSGEVVAKAGEKITAKRARELAEAGLKEVLFGADDLAGRYLAEDIVNLETGQIYGEAGDELDAKLLEALQGSQGQGVPDPRHRPRHGRRLHPQHAATSTRTPTARKR